MSTALKIPQPKLISWDEYERTERTSDVRHKFVNGEVFVMPVNSWNHKKSMKPKASSSPK